MTCGENEGEPGMPSNEAGTAPKGQPSILGQQEQHDHHKAASTRRVNSAKTRVDKTQTACFAMVMSTMCDQSGMVANTVSDQVGATKVLVPCFPMEKILVDNKVSNQVGANNKVTDQVGPKEVLVRYFPTKADADLDANDDDDPNDASANDNDAPIAGVNGDNNTALIAGVNNNNDNAPITGVNDDNNTAPIRGVNNDNAPIAGVSNDDAPIAGVIDAMKAKMDWWFRANATWRAESR
jgi:hypothetical protein